MCTSCFNSLFEMQSRAGRRVWSAAAPPRFNSLFEMLDTVSGVEAVDDDEIVSILYLRCVVVTLRNPARGQEGFNSLFETP